MRGPCKDVSRNPHLNLPQWRDDMVAVWNLSRMWYFTGDQRYAKKARDILIAWADTQETFSGMEAPLDLGDYAYRWAGGADILRGTWPGWTVADTRKVKALFKRCYQPLHSLDVTTLGPTNKGSLALGAAIAAAVFCDDVEMAKQIIRLYRTCPSTGLVSSLSNGQQGETGRDQGHSYAHLLQMSFISEVLWKQGLDVYSEQDNRLLAMGEYFSRYNLEVPTPYVPMGTTDEYYTTNWSTWAFGGDPVALSILRGHYLQRKGMSAPYIESKLAAQGVNSDSFVFYKPGSGDQTTARPPEPVVSPSHRLVTKNLTSLDVGGAKNPGSSSYENGVWTVKGAGIDIWTHGPEKFHFAYKELTGDCTIIAKINSVENTHKVAKAGIMIRSDLKDHPDHKMWIAITPSKLVESYMHGWTTVYGGSNWEAQSYGIPHTPWWVKIERRGDMITAYASPDGASWATQVYGAFAKMDRKTYVGLCVTSMVEDTPCTAAFSNVSITGGDQAAPIAPPEAPLSVLASPGNGEVPIRWSESFGATSYTVKRSTNPGGPYTTIANVTEPSYVDTTVQNGTSYTYVASASNAAGESPDSPADTVTPRARLVNIVGSGRASASHNADSEGEGAARAFDWNSGSKWFNGNSGTTGWIQYDLGADGGSTIAAYEIVSANDMPARDPKDWELQGSDDGSTWTTLDTRTGESFGEQRQFAKRYPVSNHKPNRYYRLNVTANNGDPTGLQLGELALLKPAARQPVGEIKDN